MAGKTGTTNDATDAWFVGYTPEVVAAVWVGFDQPRPITAAATGGRVAAPVWGRMMARLYEGRRPPTPWKAPPNVVRATVDSDTGLVVTEGCESSYAYNELFLRGHVPAETCPGEWPTEARDDEDVWEDVERRRRQSREEWLEDLREELERRLRERRRWIEEEEERREDEEKRARRERRRREKEKEERRRGEWESALKIPLTIIRYFHKFGNVEAIEAVEALGALAQESRLAIFRLLVRQGPDGLPAGDVAEAVGIPPATLSFHLAQLGHAGLVRSRREGRRIIYSADYDGLRR